jgi:uncharacterized membrane protein YgcG
MIYYKLIRNYNFIYVKRFAYFFIYKCVMIFFTRILWNLIYVIDLFITKMNTKAICTIVALLPAVVLAGTLMGTQYVSAWHHGHHGGHVSAMANSTSSGGGGGSSGSGSSGGGGY